MFKNFFMHYIDPKIVIQWNFDFDTVTVYLCSTCVGLFHLLINVKRWNQTEYKRCCHSAIQVIKTSQLMSHINWLTILQYWWEIMPMALIYSYYNLSYKWNATFCGNYIKPTYSTSITNEVNWDNFYWTIAYLLLLS